AHNQSIPRFPLHRILDLDVGAGRHVPGCAHSVVRDGGDAPAIDGPRKCRPTGDRCGWRGELIGAVQSLLRINAFFAAIVPIGFWPDADVSAASRLSMVYWKWNTRCEYSHVDLKRSLAGPDDDQTRTCRNSPIRSIAKRPSGKIRA